MSEKEKVKAPEIKKKLGLSSPGKLELRKTIEGGTVRQSFSHGRVKSVTVEVKKVRTFKREGTGSMSEVSDKKIDSFKENIIIDESKDSLGSKENFDKDSLSDTELNARKVALQKSEEEKKLESFKKAESNFSSESKSKADLNPKEKEIEDKLVKKPASIKSSDDDEKTRKAASKKGRADLKKQLSLGKKDVRRKSGKMTIQQAFDGEERQRSLASIRRAREKEKKALENEQKQDVPQKKLVREVIVPEFITVQELANRMAVRSTDVIKVLIANDVMVTATETIDADTAEIVVLEFGHIVKRISESDVEIGLKSGTEEKEDAVTRPPIVTVMGHVDHGKTTLLDSLRNTDVVMKEDGGITQHIGAYQLQTPGGSYITFIDTPGHAAFSAMRSRGARFTDIVILVVAANDGVMPQTIEAIQHAKAAGVPIILAINKIDLEGADSSKVQQELLQHNIVVEKMGGDVPVVEVSALKKINLKDLIENIELQAEVLELKASHTQRAEGVILESKREQGRGVVATVLLQRGILKSGNIVVAGTEWGRIRAILDNKGKPMKEIMPSFPAEILGLNDTPLAGDEIVVVDNEARAKEVSEYRKAVALKKKTSISSRAASADSILKSIKGSGKKFLPIILKSDAIGSQEAISSSLEDIGNDEVSVQILLSGVGGITESDITLASANEALIVGFNVRADPTARKLAKQQGVDIRYYSIIYEIFDEVKSLLSGLLSPIVKENFLGYAEIKQIFKVSKVGKVGGCQVTEGVVKRGASVRLLRDNVVVHAGELSTLKRHSDEVSEVKEGLECGISFVGYNDIVKNDVIECYEIETTERSLDDS